MKSILDGKLYDTDKSENLCNFPNHSIYRTKNGALFITYNGDDMPHGRISCTDQEIVKAMIGQYCPDVYIELFGEPEEA